jgi:hypothetical protein
VERRRKLFNNRANPQANPVVGSNDLGAIYGALSIPVFTSDKMIEWKLGSEDRPLGQAVIYCKQANGMYATAFCDAAKREGFYDQLPEKSLEGVIEKSKEREIDIIYLGEKKAHENCVELVLFEIGAYQILYNKQPANIKKASSRLPVVTDQ